MTWKELKSQCLSLGFEKDGAYTKNAAAFIEAANEAMRIIAVNIRPITASLHIEQNGEKPENTEIFGEYAAYDLRVLALQDGVSRFMSLSERPPSVITDSGFQTVTNYRLQMGYHLLLPWSTKGSFIVWYNRMPTTITNTTPDNFEIELDPEVCELAKYLMANYIWLDDDERKAVYYYNKYDDLKNQILFLGRATEAAPTLENTTKWWS